MENYNKSTIKGLMRTGNRGGGGEKSIMNIRYALNLTIEYVDAIPLTNSQKTRYILNEMQ